VLRPGVLRVSDAGQVFAADVADRLRPFIARRIPAQDVDDVLQDTFVRMQRGLANLRDDTRTTPWLYQIARRAVADHLRARQRHPLAERDPDEPVDQPTGDESHALAGCLATFVATLPSPYREAVTLVELEGLTAREAAAMVGISTSGMKSRVQRGRAELRRRFEVCCRIALDARNKVIEVTPRAPCCAPNARPD